MNHFSCAAGSSGVFKTTYEVDNQEAKPVFEGDHEIQEKKLVHSDRLRFRPHGVVAQGLERKSIWNWH